jgi:predicted transcriptional regulator
MNNAHNVLFSIRPNHVAEILNGNKTVELRRRRPHIVAGSRIWIYATSPTAALKGYAKLDRVETAAPSTIWERFKGQVGVSKRDFDHYFAGQSVAHALVLSDVRELANPLILKTIRKFVRGFHPPQFFCHLNGEVAELRLNSRKLRKR